MGQPRSFESDQHERLYNYITKRFLASCSINAKGSETIVNVRVGVAEYFTAQGLIVEEKGYLEIFIKLHKIPVDKRLNLFVSLVGRSHM